MPKGLILLDRDGVLNSLFIDPEQGTIDSPLHPHQVHLIEGAAEAVAMLTQAGYALSIVSNQPAAAKGKTTRHNLDLVQEKVISLVEAQGGRISSSHLCFHRQEDLCSCRKPKTGLLEEAIKKNTAGETTPIWIVGDGITDIQAGKALGLETAFIATHKCETCQQLLEHNLKPTWWVSSLFQFSMQMTSEKKGKTHV